jgi:hypothetical protein
MMDKAADDNGQGHPSAKKLLKRGRTRPGEHFIIQNLVSRAVLWRRARAVAVSGPCRAAGRQNVM